MSFPPPRNLGLSADTELAIRTIVEEKMANRECFFALDVTNEVKQRGYKTQPPSNFGSHREMAPVVADHAKALAPVHGYVWALLDVGNGTEQAWLYFPDGTATATIQSHVNRRVTPLVPVDIWAQQVSQQASGIQAQAVNPVRQTMDKLQATVQTKDAATGPAVLGRHILRLIRGGK